jgi:hypothetical protein
MFICGLASYWLGVSVLGMEGYVALNSFRDALSQQPAVVIVATLFTCIAGLFLLSALLTSYHEFRHNHVASMRIGTYFFAVLFASGLLLAPCALVPATRDYWTPDFNGARWFQLTLLLWLLWNDVLLVHRRFLASPPARFGCNRIWIELISSIATIVMLAQSISNVETNRTTLSLDAGWVIPLFIWSTSFADTRCITFYFEQVRVADAADSMLADEHEWKARDAAKLGAPLRRKATTRSLAKTATSSHPTLKGSLSNLELPSPHSPGVFPRPEGGTSGGDQDDQARNEHLLKEINLLEAAINATDENDPAELRAELEQQLMARKEAYAANTMMKI